MNRRLFILIGAGFVGLLVFLLLLVALFSGGNKDKGTGDKGPITLTYWRAFDDSDKFDQLIRDYEAEHPKVRIEYRKLTFREYERTLVDSIAGGRGPDIFMVHDTWLPRYFDKISPMPAKKYNPDDYKREFYPPAYQTLKDDRIYGLPLAIDTLGMYLNENVELDADVGETPDTWEELGRVLRPINRRSGDNFSRSAIALGDTAVSRHQDILALLMLQYRTKMTNEENTQATFNLTQDVEGQQRARGREALEFYTSFAKPGSPRYSWNGRGGNSIRAFAKGRVAYMIGYAYLAPQIERLNPDLRFDIRPMLQIAGTSAVNYSSYWAETVSRNSEHKDEAWDFLRYLTARDQMRTYAEATRTIPARNDVAAGGGLDELQEQLLTARSWYKGDTSKADKIFTRMILQVLSGESPQNAIDRGATDLTKEFRRLKGLDT